jgi:hypothetical protein
MPCTARRIDEIPPATQSLRYGNPSYRVWHARLVQEAAQLLADCLPEALHPAIPDLVPYLTGNSHMPFIRHAQPWGHCLAPSLGVTACPLAFYQNWQGGSWRGITLVFIGFGDRRVWGFSKNGGSNIWHAMHFAVNSVPVNSGWPFPNDNPETR